MKTHWRNNDPQTSQNPSDFYSMGKHYYRTEMLLGQKVGSSFREQLECLCAASRCGEEPLLCVAAPDCQWTPKWVWQPDSIASSFLTERNVNSQQSGISRFIFTLTYLSPFYGASSETGIFGSKQQVFGISSACTWGLCQNLMLTRDSSRDFFFNSINIGNLLMSLELKIGLVPQVFHVINV